MRLSNYAPERVMEIERQRGRLRETEADKDERKRGHP